MTESDSSLPDSLDDAIFEALGLNDETQREATFERLCAAWPRYESAIRQRANPLVTPKTFGRFELLGELGSGGMGRVHLAYDPELGREVAVKEMWRWMVADDNLRARFAREATVLAKLRHRGICRIHEIGSAATEERGDKVPFLVMEFVEGQSLRAFLVEERAAEQPAQRTDADIQRWVSCIASVARAVHHAHEAGLVHRDLKPSNVLITPDMEPVVIDFGLARDDNDAIELTDSGFQPGTPAYKAPEQVRAKRSPIGPHTDVWALGVLAYECLALERPFGQQERHELEAAILDEEPLPLRRRVERVSSDLSTVIHKALRKDARERYGSALEFAEDLDRALHREPIRARPVPWIGRVVRWSQRNPLAAAMLVALSIAVGTATLFALQAVENARVAKLQAAHSALGEGDWRGAEALFEEAFSLGADYTPILGLELLQCFEGSMQTGKIRAELERLGNYTDHPQLGATIRLQIADQAANRLKDPDDRLDEIRGVVDDPTLSEANREYAQALLAESLPDCRSYLERALTHDPRHRRANELLGPTLLILGEVDAAEQLALRMRALYPHDPIAQTLLAMSAGCRDRESEAFAAALSDLRSRGPSGPDLADAVELILDTRALLAQEVSNTIYGTGEGPVATFLKLHALHSPGKVINLLQKTNGLIRAPRPLEKVVHRLGHMVSTLLKQQAGSWLDRLRRVQLNRKMRQTLIEGMDDCYAHIPDATFKAIRALANQLDMHDLLQSGSDYLASLETNDALNIDAAAAWKSQEVTGHLVFQHDIDETTKSRALTIATSGFEYLLDTDQLDVNGFAYTANSFLQWGDPMRALFYAQQFCRRFPDEAQAPIWMCDAALKLNAPDLAEVCLDETVRRGYPEESHIASRRARIAAARRSQQDPDSNATPVDAVFPKRASSPPTDK